MDQISFERKSDAVNPGETQGIGTTSEVVFDADDVDGGNYFWLYNNSDTTIWVRYAATGAAAGAGFPLVAGAYIEEDRYAGAVCAAHGGTGDKSLVKGIV